LPTTWGQRIGNPPGDGDLVHDPAGKQPPFVILNPAETRVTAEFLRTVSFDERWRIAGAQLSRPYAGWTDKDAARTTFLGCHHDLRTFYQRAAQAGHAVVKAFWY
jgi:Domain of unknown function (DUF1877)